MSEWIEQRYETAERDRARTRRATGNPNWPWPRVPAKPDKNETRKEVKREA